MLKCPFVSRAVWESLHKKESGRHTSPVWSPVWLQAVVATDSPQTSDPTELASVARGFLHYRTSLECNWLVVQKPVNRRRKVGGVACLKIKHAWPNRVSLERLTYKCCDVGRNNNAPPSCQIGAAPVRKRCSRPSALRHGRGSMPHGLRTWQVVAK